MRRIIFTAAALFVLFASPLAAQEHDPLEWQEYVYPELGIAKEFPASPQRQTGSYQTEVVGEDAVPSVAYFVDFGDLIFQMTVVDLRAPEHVLRAANILAECIFLAESAGLPLANLPLDVKDDTQFGVHGRVVSVDLNYNLGVRQTACLHKDGRLYKMEATMVHPEEEDGEAIARFVTSQRFDLGKH